MVLKPESSPCRRKGSVLLMAFWCLMALSFAVFALHEQSITDYKAMAKQVEKEQAYWAAVGGGQRVASYIVSLSEPSSLFDLDRGPSWFGEPGGTIPSSDSPANLLGLHFKVCKKAFGKNHSDFNVEDEAGRININNCPSGDVTTEYINSGGKESTVLESLFTSVSNSLRIDDISDPAGAAAIFASEKQSRVSAQGGSSSSGQETFVAEDVFRHPYDLLVNTGLSPQWLFGEDINCNSLLDPSEDDNSDLKTYPADDGDSTLDLGMIDKITAYSDGKFNIYTACDETDSSGNSTLSIMFSDFPEILSLVRDARNGGEKPNPNSFIPQAYPEKTNPKRRQFRAFRSEYLTQTERSDYFRITVQAYLRDGAWGGCLEQVFKLERESSGGGSGGRPGGKYLRPLFKQFK